MHSYLLLVTDPKSHDQLNQQLIGPLSSHGRPVIDEKTGIQPPAWWRGDEYASRSGMAAMVTLRRR